MHMILELRIFDFFSVQSSDIWLKVYFNLQKNSGTERVWVWAGDAYTHTHTTPCPFLAYPPHTHFFSIFHTHTHYKQGGFGADFSGSGITPIPSLHDCCIQLFIAHM